MKNLAWAILGAVAMLVIMAAAVPQGTIVATFEGKPITEIKCDVNAALQCSIDDKGTLHIAESFSGPSIWGESRYRFRDNNHIALACVIDTPTGTGVDACDRLAIEAHKHPK